MSKLFLILNNIRSAQNVGALFRTADGAGVAEILLVGYTPHPPKKGKLFLTPAEKALKKTALGSEEMVSWRTFRTLPMALRYLQPKKVTVVALEQDKRSVDYRTFEVRGDIALLVGNEVDGLSEEERKLLANIIELPMRGKKESLNVSVAGGIALYHLQATMEKDTWPKKIPKNKRK